MLKIGRSRLIFNVGIPILVRHLYIYETPGPVWDNWYFDNIIVILALLQHLYSLYDFLFGELYFQKIYLVIISGNVKKNSVNRNKMEKINNKPYIAWIS